jgi:hypothetical protein
MRSKYICTHGGMPEISDMSACSVSSMIFSSFSLPVFDAVGGVARLLVGPQVGRHVVIDNARKPPVLMPPFSSSTGLPERKMSLRSRKSPLPVSCT